MKRLFFLVFVFFSFSILLQAQELQLPHYGEGEGAIITNYLTNKLESGEVVPFFVIKEIVVTRKRTFKTVEDHQRYLRLERNVLRVLPYAIYAQRRYEKLDRELAMVSSKREEKRLIKICEDEIKAKFNAEIKNLSISQGAILIKLIQRQTGSTSYELVKEMKGGLSAFFFQSVAKVFGHNLKNTYDVEEDYEIENIIRSYERVRPIKNLYNY
ncbi:DUF4294 domain-containing protein [Sphingobacterium sp. UT-1RO-CII-1]|uniref:DUF4294 domain-containing protein n=1 Tax=Sphingobacterium sp. UT-1RO-CII-1 TaxID=2995225 RepID=UPI00227C58BA|nr:DUF4294 domain-containing protein [Sphingobacterium sp. UT-1RO-CII-1]MCY4779190.1 DUF4294 domain-containing protein [Sphingobacterium sp. UT-1RO-CII-1]